MIRTSILLGFVALLCMGAAPAPNPADQPYDAADPASLVALLADLDASASIVETADDAVFLRVASPAFGFNVRFAGCDTKGRNCKAVAFETLSEARTATVAQLNAFNQTSLNCRVWRDRTGRPHVMYATLVFPQDAREEMVAHLGAWRGCAATFVEFLMDPNAYLATAP